MVGEGRRVCWEVGLRVFLQRGCRCSRALLPAVGEYYQATTREARIMGVPRRVELRVDDSLM